MITLQYAANKEEIRQSLETFNRQSRHFPEFIRYLLRHVIYWVHDPEKGSFAPNLFVAFHEMTVEKYQEAREGAYEGVSFDASEARRVTERVIAGEFVNNSELTIALEAWGISLLRDVDVFTGIERSKWKFLQIQ
ncbi:MAG: hypothetical protein ACP5GX_04235 [Anaerolineae bacterium]